VAKVPWSKPCAAACASCSRENRSISRGGAGLAEGTAGDDFALLGGEVTEVLEILRGNLDRSHELSFLGLAPKEKRD
jgi:hypothetical protein